MSAQNNQEQNKYLILDPNQKPLARAYLSGELSTGSKEFSCLEKHPPDLTCYPALSILSLTSDEFTAWSGKVQAQRGSRFTFFPTETLSEETRRNLRVALRFDTYIYPSHPHSFGRLSISSFDISCGGIALFSSIPLAPGETYTIVIPILHTPLILPIRVLRPRSIEMDGQTLSAYSCTFYDLLPQEEALLRETIFDYQLKHQSAS